MNIENGYYSQKVTSVYAVCMCIVHVVAESYSIKLTFEELEPIRMQLHTYGIWT